MFSFNNRLISILVASMVTCGHVVAAESRNDLTHFVENLKTLEANFTQTLEDENGRQLQKQQGTVAIKKPGKLNWHYQTPYDQRLVINADKFWFYDVDLEQVTIKSSADALGAAPVALLTSAQPLQEQFAITELGKIGEHYMWQLKPKVQDMEYGAALLAFDKDGMLVLMQLKDSLAQVTTIEFDHIKLNQLKSDKIFEFKVPEGVDVISEL